MTFCRLHHLMQDQIFYLSDSGDDRCVHVARPVASFKWKWKVISLAVGILGTMHPHFSTDACEQLWCIESCHKVQRATNLEAVHPMHILGEEHESRTKLHICTSSLYCLDQSDATALDCSPAIKRAFNLATSYSCFFPTKSKTKKPWDSWDG